MSAALTEAERERLVRVLGLLSSNHDGERAAAGHMASQMLRSRGLDWQAVIAPVSLPMSRQPEMTRPAQTPTRAAAASCKQIAYLLRNAVHLNGWETSFLQSTAHRRRLTFKQIEVLDRIYDRLVGEGIR